MKRVAVTGFGVVSPVGTGRRAFFDALCAGRGGIAPITHFDATTFAVRLAGEVQKTSFSSLDVAAAAERDPKVGFAFAACAEALRSAGVKRLDAETLLHLGVSLEIFHLDDAVLDGRVDFVALAERGLKGERPPLQTPLDTAQALIQKHWGRAGRSLTNVSACAAGAQAIGHAFREIRAGRGTTAVCGGFDSMLNPLGVGGFQLLGALTVENHLGERACRPFDAARAGTVLGEGAAVLVLESLDRALAEGKEVIAEVCGYGSTLDAHGLSAPDPEGAGAVRAMREALADARLSPERIAHINAHGTGTRLNDEIEAKAIRCVFADSWKNIPVSATKALTGHLIAAAGAIEAGACLAVLNENILPPNPSLDKVGVGCELDHVAVARHGFQGEYVMSNSFGFGGQNATLIFRRFTK